MSKYNTSIVSGAYENLLRFITKQQLFDLKVVGKYLQATLVNGMRFSVPNK